MRGSRNLALQAPSWLLLTAGIGLALVRGLRTREEETDDEAPHTTREPPRPDADGREIIALARMLESETRDTKARIVLGWITIQAARSWKKTIFRLLTGRSGQWGHQKHFGPDGRAEIRYASTVEAPGAEALRLARGLLSDRIRPSALVERTRPTAFVEMGKASRKKGPDGNPLQPAYDAERILKRQRSYGGIVARVNNWFLYAQKAKPIADIKEAIAL